jgi:hypothetical protein
MKRSIGIAVFPGIEECDFVGPLHVFATLHRRGGIRASHCVRRGEPELAQLPGRQTPGGAGTIRDCTSDAEAAQASSSSAGWVVTHGERFGPNLLPCSDARLRLVDGDSLLMAPRERDLWEVRDRPTWSTYWGIVDARIDEDRLRLYCAWYDRRKQRST